MQFIDRERIQEILGRQTQNGGLSSNASLPEILDAQTSRLNTYLDPAIDDALAQVDSTEIVDSARERANKAFTGAREQNRRQMSRYGVRQTGVQREQFERRLGRADTLNRVQTSSNAKLAQRQRNLSVLTDLSNRGQGLSNIGTSGLVQSTARDSARTQANRTNSQNYRNGMLGTAATLGSLAIFGI